MKSEDIKIHEDDEKLAKRAYEAYGKTVDFKNYQGLPMPKWEDLSTIIRLAWVNACVEAIIASRED